MWRWLTVRGVMRLQPAGVRDVCRGRLWEREYIHGVDLSLWGTSSASDLRSEGTFGKWGYFLTLPLKDLVWSFRLESYRGKSHIVLVMVVHLNHWDLKRSSSSPCAVTLSWWGGLCYSKTLRAGGSLSWVALRWGADERQHDRFGQLTLCLPLSYCC